MNVSQSIVSHVFYRRISVEKLKMKMKLDTPFILYCFTFMFRDLSSLKPLLCLLITHISVYLHIGNIYTRLYVYHRLIYVVCKIRYKFKLLVCLNNFPCRTKQLCLTIIFKSFLYEFNYLNGESRLREPET